MKKLLSRMMNALQGEGRAPRYGTEVPCAVADFGEKRALSELQVASLRKLIELLAARLGTERASAIAERAIQAFEPWDEADMAFLSGTSLGVGHTLSIYLDWNDSSEVDWIVNRILETLEIPDRWHWGADGGDGSIPAAFRALEEWLSLRGYQMRHVNTGGDNALAVPVELKDAILAERLARDAGMDLFTLKDSEPYYGAGPA